MIKKIVLVGVLAAFAVIARAQSAPELVSKGMAAEQSGNLDSALQFFRQTTATPSEERVYAGYSQFRISQILLQKGDLASAAQEFSKLARDYPESSDLISTFLAEERPDIFHTGASGPASRSMVRGQAAAATPIASGRYRHQPSGVELDLQGWTVAGEVPSTGGGEIAQLSDPGSTAPAMVWMRRDRLAPSDIRGRLHGALQQKILQRLSYQDYKVRRGSVQERTIGGKSALSAVADFVENGQPMAEYLTWIYTEHTRVLFFARLPRASLSDYQQRLDAIISTSVIP